MKLKQSLFILLSVTLLSYTSFAELPHQTSERYRRLCGDVTNKNGTSQTSNENEQKVTYCTSAKHSQNAAIANGVLATAWAAVAAVCFAQCGNPTLEIGQACNGVSLAAGIVDSATTALVEQGIQEDIEALSTNRQVARFASIGSGAVGGMGLIANKTDGADSRKAERAKKLAEKNEKRKAAGKKAKKGSDAMACVNGTLAAAMSTIKFVNTGLFEANRRKNLDTVERLLDDHKPTINNDDDENNGLLLGGNRSGSGRGGSTALGSNGDIEKETESNPDCKSAVDTGDNGSALSCAGQKSAILAQIQPLGLFDDFEKLTGTDVGSFSQDSYNQQVPPQSGVGSLFDTKGENPAAMNAFLESIEKKAAHVASGGGYKGGGGSHSGGGKSGPNVNRMMAGVLEAMGLGKKNKKGNIGTHDIEFKMKGRSPAQVFKDRSLSLFDRVGYRYKKNQRNLTRLPYSTHYNRVTTRQ
ncbi:MAG: hypothetical protein CL678_09685 [Bdellovibrionaceae bacterium]|nr:hypothetical protein [Pseudobdellovibrionaceae bacterium]|tara:strand:+ start:710 stop:2119 length:1410 start_codon:yes stop_codon:yes gene_type:complete